MNTIANTLTNSFPIEEQIQRELNDYKQALKFDEEYYVRKTIKEKIQMLEDQLRQRQMNFTSFR